MGANNLYFPSVQEAFRFGNAGNFTIVNDTKSGLPLKMDIGTFFAQAATKGYLSSTFIGLTDVSPTTFVGQANKLVAVNAGETALEFITVATDTNFANTGLTFLQGQIHNLATFDLVFDNVGTFKVDGTTKIISPSASALDNAFVIRNNTDTGELINVDATGVARFYQNVYGYATNYFETIRSPYFPNCSIVLSTAITSTARGEVGVAYTGHVFDTFDTLTTAGCKLGSFANGGSVKWYIDKNGTINAPGTQIGNVGLASGDEYYDTAANILTNGDLIRAKKV